MKTMKEKELLNDLLKSSICEKCETQMKFRTVPIYQLDEPTQDLIIQHHLKYQVVTCPKCGSNGLHIYYNKEAKASLSYSSHV
jgi:Zn finger protein HypA/HybF involved in hydrogenase expression